MNLQQLLGYLGDDEEKKELMELHAKVQSSSEKRTPLIDLRHSTSKDEPDISTKQSLAYYQSLLKAQKATIKSSKLNIETQQRRIADLKKEAFGIYGYSQKSRQAKKQKKHEIKSAKMSLKSSKQALQDACAKKENIRHTISQIKNESREAKNKLASYEKSILEQTQTQKLLQQIKSVLPRIPNLNDPKYKAMIAFYTQYSKKGISIHNSLPRPSEISPNIKSIVIYELGKQMAEKGIKSIRGIAHTVQTFTGHSTDLQGSLRKWATKSANTRPTFFKEATEFLRDTNSPVYTMMLPIMLQVKQMLASRQPATQQPRALPASKPALLEER